MEKQVVAVVAYTFDPQNHQRLEQEKSKYHIKEIQVIDDVPSLLMHKIDFAQPQSFNDVYVAFFDALGFYIVQAKYKEATHFQSCRTDQPKTLIAPLPTRLQLSAYLDTIDIIAQHYKTENKNLLRTIRPSDPHEEEKEEEEEDLSKYKKLYEEIQIKYEYLQRSRELVQKELILKDKEIQVMQTQAFLSRFLLPK